ncbi:MAG: Ig-like domain repeat protein [Actinomycetota bacterium]|nr:MAG: Ig-like domain repeat protein [Actinomycetota bacterium]
MPHRSRLRRTAIAAVSTAASTALIGTLGIAAAPAASAAPIDVTGAVLTWSGSRLLQSAAPIPGQCHYFSAGLSDPGDLADSYAATAGNVSIRKAAAAATYATRCDGATTAAGVDQQVVVTGGTGTTDPATGAGTIQWTGTWSVNMYGGLAPFSITNPKLTVAADGSSTVTATLDGYAGSMGSSGPATPVAAVPNVVVARFAGLTPVTGFDATPLYSGVEYNATGSAPQNRTAAGWGSWPASFVDFQATTGLASFFYSSGAASDGTKAPAAVEVDYDLGPVTATAGIKLGTKLRTVPAAKRLKLKAVVTAALRGSAFPAEGKVFVYDGTKKIKKGVLDDGKAVVTLPALAPGRHKLTVVFPGAGGVPAATSTVKSIRVVR